VTKRVLETKYIYRVTVFFTRLGIDEYPFRYECSVCSKMFHNAVESKEHFKAKHAEILEKSVRLGEIRVKRPNPPVQHHDMTMSMIRKNRDLILKAIGRESFKVLIVSARVEEADEPAEDQNDAIGRLQKLLAASLVKKESAGGVK
jgi:hypothetical protein